MDTGHRRHSWTASSLNHWLWVTLSTDPKWQPLRVPNTIVSGSTGISSETFHMAPSTTATHSRVLCSHCAHVNRPRDLEVGRLADGTRAALVVFKWVIFMRRRPSNHALSLSNPPSALREDPYGRTSAPSLYPRGALCHLPPHSFTSPPPSPSQPYRLFWLGGEINHPSSLGIGRRLAIMLVHGLISNVLLSEISLSRTPYPTLLATSGFCLHPLMEGHNGPWAVLSRESRPFSFLTVSYWLPVINFHSGIRLIHTHLSFTAKVLPTYATIGRHLNRQNHPRVPRLCTVLLCRR